LEHDQPGGDVVGGWAAAIAAEARQARHVSLYFAASSRKNAIGWANCSRQEMEKLNAFPHAIIKVSGRRRRRLTAQALAGAAAVKAVSSVAARAAAVAAPPSSVAFLRRGRNGDAQFAANATAGARSDVRAEARRLQEPRRRRLRFAENTFADHMRAAAICPLVCGDTPTSRRTFDAFLAGCVPLFVGTRLWGRCDPPCRPGWGWRVPGAPFPHLPFHGLWIDWSRFPLLDELALVAAPSHAAAVDVLKRALKPFHDQVSTSL
jgi:hypothetical protein